MIYVDTSVLLASLFAEDRRPKSEFWSTDLVSSRLLEYEAWSRIHARHAAQSHGARARELLRGVMLVELSCDVLRRALRPFPRPARTLDGLHLSTLDFVRAQRESVALASYDERLIAAARSMRFRIHAL